MDKINLKEAKEKILKENPQTHAITSAGTKYEITIFKGQHNIKFKAKAKDVDGNLWEGYIWDTEMKSKITCPYLIAEDNKLDKLEEHLRTKLASNEIELLRVKNNTTLELRYSVEVEDEKKFYNICLKPMKEEVSFNAIDITLFTQEIIKVNDGYFSTQEEIIKAIKEELSGREGLKEKIQQIENNLNKHFEAQREHTKAIVENIIKCYKSSNEEDLSECSVSEENKEEVKISAKVKNGGLKAVLTMAIEETIARNIDSLYKSIDERLKSLEDKIENISKDVQCSSGKITTDIHELKKENSSTAESIRNLKLEDKMAKVANNLKSEIISQIDNNSEKLKKSNEDIHRDLLNELKELDYLESRVKSVRGSPVAITLSSSDSIDNFSIIDKVLKLTAIL
jgi:hypothetical protein